jgi:hypothetical protein
MLIIQIASSFKLQASASIPMEERDIDPRAGEADDLKMSSKV